MKTDRIFIKFIVLLVILTCWVTLGTCRLIGYVPPWYAAKVFVTVVVTFGVMFYMFVEFIVYMNNK